MWCTKIKHSTSRFSNLCASLCKNYCLRNYSLLQINGSNSKEPRKPGYIMNFGVIFPSTTPKWLAKNYGVFFSQKTSPVDFQHFRADEFWVIIKFGVKQPWNSFWKWKYRGKRERLLVSALDDFFGSTRACSHSKAVRKSRGSLIKLSPLREANREAQFN